MGGGLRGIRPDATFALGSEGLTPRLDIARGTRLLRCSGLFQCRDLAFNSPQERRLRTCPLHHADSGKTRFRIGAVPPEFQVDSCFVAARQTHVPPETPHAIWTPRVAVTARILSECDPPPWSPAHGGSVDLRWIRVRDRRKAVLGTSRAVSCRAGSVWKISMAAATSIPTTLLPGRESDMREFESREPVQWISCG